MWIEYANDLEKLFTALSCLESDFLVCSGSSSLRGHGECSKKARIEGKKYYLVIKLPELKSFNGQIRINCWAAKLSSTLRLYEEAASKIITKLTESGLVCKRLTSIVMNGEIKISILIFMGKKHVD